MAVRPQLGFCFDRSFPAAEVVHFARRLEADGIDELWLIEDCFYTSAVPLAATALAATQQLTVGLGILPAVARNPAITAMEIATLCGLAPGRLVAGIGHGEQTWMAQIGAATPSPVTTLEEVITAVRQLLDGQRVTTRGRYVTLDDVGLDQPPDPVPLVLAGVRGPRSLAMAGRVANGLVLAEATGPTALRQAILTAAPHGPFEVIVFAALCVTAQRQDAYDAMAPFLAGLLGKPSPGLRAHPYFEEIATINEKTGIPGLGRMPQDWWDEIGMIGTLEDAQRQRAALHEAGAGTVACFPAAELEIARAQLADAAALVP